MKRGLKRVTEAQRRALKMLDAGICTGIVLRPATRAALLDLGLVEEIDDGASALVLMIRVKAGIRPPLRLTDRGRKYLDNWSRAYGSGVSWRG